MDRRVTDTSVLSRIASDAKWRAAHEALIAKEKGPPAPVIRSTPSVVANRWLRLASATFSEGPRGNLDLLDLFERRRQLTVYHFIGRGVHS
jgi:predicted dithiol-disulfide oxidoreductase (DUF899 family)